MSEKQPEGWYDDPEMVNTRRYWDGDAWTDHRQEMTTNTPPQGAPAVVARDPDASTPGKAERGWLIAGLVFIAIVIVGSIVGSIFGNSGGSNSDDTTAGTSAPSKYQQTWSKAYASTSCDEWTNTMDPHQRFAAAADMLTGARNKGDGGTGLPSDSLVRAFEQDVDEACASSTSSLAETGASVYLVGRSLYRP